MQMQSNLSKVGFMSRGKYLLDQVGKPKVRPHSAEPPDKSLRVKEGMFPTTPLPMGISPIAASNLKAQKSLAKSQSVGAPGMAVKPPKPATMTEPIGQAAANSIKAAAARMAKIAFADSGFGPTGGAFRPRYASFQGTKPIPSPIIMDPNIKQAAVPLTPRGRLANTTQKGHPKLTGFSGPSEASISKPVGYGEALPGATKS
jgi:hypothetical protein